MQDDIFTKYKIKEWTEHQEKGTCTWTCISHLQSISEPFSQDTCVTMKQEQAQLLRVRA